MAEFGPHGGVAGLVGPHVLVDTLRQQLEVAGPGHAPRVAELHPALARLVAQLAGHHSRRKQAEVVLAVAHPASGGSQLGAQAALHVPAVGQWLLVTGVGRRHKLSVVKREGQAGFGYEIRAGAGARAVSESVYMISTVAKPVLGILSGYPGRSGANGFLQQVAGAGLGRA